MAIVTSTSISVSPDVLARIAQLGLQRQFEQMLEHTKKSVPGLRAIDVVLAFDPECVEEPRIILEATRDETGSEYDPTQWNWNSWVRPFHPRCFNTSSS